MLCLQPKFQNTYDRKASQTHYFSSKVSIRRNDRAHLCCMPLKFPSHILHIFFTFNMLPTFLSVHSLTKLDQLNSTFHYLFWLWYTVQFFIILDIILSDFSPSHTAVWHNWIIYFLWSTFVDVRCQTAADRPACWMICQHKPGHLLPVI